MTRRTRQALTVVLCAALVGGVGAVEDGPSPLPPLVLEGMEPAVRERLAAARTNLDATLERPDATPATLAEAYGELGRAAHAYRLFDLATACFENALALAPDDFRWRYHLGVLYQLEGRWREAVEHFRAARETRPEYRPLAVRLGQVYLRAGELERARAELTAALALEPYATAARAGLGRLAAEEGEYETAVAHFRAVLERQPAAGEIHQQLGLVYRARDELERAREHLRRDTRGAVAFPDPVIESLEDDFPAGHLATVLAATRRDDYAAVADAYRGLLAAEPENASYLRGLGGALGRLGDLDGAVDAYRRALELQPERAIGHLRLALALLRRDDGAEVDAAADVAVDPEAIGHLRTALEIAPDLQEAHRVLATALERGDPLGALEHLERAIALDPGDTDSRLRRARMLLRLGRREPAAAAIDELLATSPDNAETHLLHSRLLLERGELEAAADAARRVLEHAPPPPIAALAHLRLGALYQRLGRSDDEVIAELRAAVELTPTAVDARVSLAGALARAERYGDAADEFARLVELAPERVDGHFGLGVSLRLAGRPAAARAALEAGRERLPAATRLTHALAALLLACEVPETCDPTAALALSRQATAERPTLIHGATLAAALVGVGRHDEARPLLVRLLEQAEKNRAGAALIAQLRAGLAALDAAAGKEDGPRP